LGAGSEGGGEENVDSLWLLQTEVGREKRGMNQKGKGVAWRAE